MIEYFLKQTKFTSETRLQGASGMLIILRRFQLRLRVGIRQLLRLRIRPPRVHGDGGHHLGLLGLVGHHVPGAEAIASTTSMPSMTMPKAAYSPSRWGASLCMMNWLPAQSGVLGPGHAQHAPGVAQIVGQAICREFTLDDSSRGHPCRCRRGTRPGS